MSVTSFGFLFFFIPLVLFVYYFPIGKRLTATGVDFARKKAVLILASLGFYCLGNVAWLLLLIASVLINYVCAQLAVRRNRKFLAVLAIVLDVLVLVFFKYVNTVIGIALPEWAGLAFPLGLSYYTFMAISYVVDSVREKRKGSLWDATLYMSFFASITSGPITQYSDFAPQLHALKADKDLIAKGAERFAYGFCKKVMIANVLGYLADDCFAGGTLSVAAAWIGGIAYTLQIYFDFSGYSDMAIGVGNLFGLELAENFHYPYAAASLSEFWKRWHMSLTKWFTKYIYFPLGGSRVNTARHIFNLWIVWLITGLWHGNGWTFFIWAMLHFTVQLMEKYLPFEKIPKAIGHIYTMLVVVVGWCIFRAESLAAAGTYLASMFGIKCNGVADASCLSMLEGYALPLLFGCLLCVPTFPWLCEKTQNKKVFEYARIVVMLAVFVIAIGFQLGINEDVPLYMSF